MSGLLQLKVRPGILAFICAIIITSGVLQIVQARAGRAEALQIVQRIESGEMNAGEKNRDELLRYWTKRAEVGWRELLPGACWIVAGAAGFAAYASWRRRVRARIDPPSVTTALRNDEPS